MSTVSRMQYVVDSLCRNATIPGLTVDFATLTVLFVLVEDLILEETSRPRHHIVLVIWHLIVLAMVTYSFFAWRGDAGFHWLWIPLFVTPLLAIAATVAPISSKLRAVCYWALAVLAAPSAAAGILSITGWFFVVSVILLIWAARRENPADEIVQM